MLGGMAWHCAKCDGRDDLPAHHRLCPKRDPDDQPKHVVTVVWPPLGWRDGRDSDAPRSPN
jgi:hypothetical protein